jgi:hypothetical protein
MDSGASSGFTNRPWADFPQPKGDRIVHGCGRSIKAMKAHIRNFQIKFADVERTMLAALVLIQAKPLMRNIYQLFNCILASRLSGIYHLSHPEKYT